MSADDPDIPDETPTTPDLAAVTCPECRGAGGFLEGEGSPGGGLKHRRCALCGGRRAVSREEHARWYAKKKGL